MQRFLLMLVWMLVLISGGVSSAQDTARPPSKPALFVFTEYSNTSSHILIGTADNRRLAGVAVGASWSLHRGNVVAIDYDLELRPLMFIRDPVSTVTRTIAFAGGITGGPFPVSDGPIPSTCISADYPDPDAGSQPGVTVTLHRNCGARWTYAGGASPLGTRFSFAPNRALQPYLLENAGFLVSTRDIPANYSSWFNFTFEFGAGVALHRGSRGAWLVDYRIRHMSNGGLGLSNPGVDNQVVRLTLQVR